MKYIKNLFFLLFLTITTLSLATSSQRIQISDHPPHWLERYPSHWFECGVFGTPTYQQHITRKELQRALRRRGILAARYLAKQDGRRTGS